jgi:hypothetical protein
MGSGEPGYHLWRSGIKEFYLRVAFLMLATWPEGGAPEVDNRVFDAWRRTVPSLGALWERMVEYEPEWRAMPFFAA